MRWVWNWKKAEANLRKHKVSFELATRVFDDPHHLSRLDPDPEKERWQTIGSPFSAGPTVLFVVHTEDDEADDGRIISARRASAHERRAYDKGEF